MRERKVGVAVEVDLIFKIAAIGIIVAVLNQLLIRSGREEQAMMTTLAALTAVLILAWAVESAAPLVEQIMDLAGGGELGGLCLSVMLKAVGLTVLGQLAAQLCKDAGEAALAYGVELAAKIAVLAVAMPVLAQLFDFLGEIIQ